MTARLISADQDHRRQEIGEPSARLIEREPAIHDGRRRAATAHAHDAVNTGRRHLTEAHRAGVWLIAEHVLRVRRDEHAVAADERNRLAAGDAEITIPARDVSEMR